MTHLLIFNFYGESVTCYGGVCWYHNQNMLGMLVRQSKVIEESL